MYCVVNVYLDHLKFCVVCINGRMYGCCSECNVVSKECNEPTTALSNISVRTVVKLCTLAGFTLGVSLVSLIVMIYACVSSGNILSSSSLFLTPFMLTCSVMKFIPLGLCVCVVSVVIGSSFACL